MLNFPNAKINLGLNVIEKRSDGFHNIETIFYPIPLCDALEIAESEKTRPFEFSSSGIPINIADKDNIVVKAFELLRNEYELPSTSIHLHKNIPFGAGLGGGSADAAFMIKMLNDFYNIGLNTGKMEDLACKLGSDCPFFISNKPVFAQGKGEIFSPTKVNLSGYFIAMIKPEIHISTPEAYAGIKPKPSANLQSLIELPPDQWKENITNDFEDSIFPNYPLLSQLKKELYNQGAVYAAMSGSGSTIFGLFTEKPVIRENWKEHYNWIGQL
ncbi:4-(cytidine 5'-diphospho)-2-C-methyl-D-erythritol kinase [Marinifilum sp. RC60d5]|uniref:4-(cytidine 5'-diphospho)-2-C-methyl-D-erythritol kinase n=1 Tax=Marinifilum sp. RC60d5 TaxID=3458414 RepID=UPI004037102D